MEIQPIEYKKLISLDVIHMSTVKLEPKLTPVNKKLVTKDWADKFPELTIYKPMWLLRRSGQILSGISLDRYSGNDAYRPTFHVHCLARSHPTISLTLCQRLATRKHGTEDSIKVRFHYELFEEAVARMRTQIQFPLSGVVKLKDVLDAYHQYIDSPAGRLYPIRLYEDFFYYYTWCGQQELAFQVLDEFMPAVNSWEPRIMEREGGAKTWYEKCLRIIADPEALHRTVDDEIIKHKLEKIPDDGFECG